MLRIAVLVLLLVAPASASPSDARSGGPFVPTPQAVVEEMLTVAGVAADDFVMDIGSGDGRIVLTAASRFHARGRGIDIDAELVEFSNGEARRRGVERLVRFQREDALKARIDDATVLTLYLLPELMHMLRDRIYSELRPGARVVSHDFRFNDWAPDRTVTIDVAEKYGNPGGWQSTIYLWIVPAKVEGRWHAAVTGPDGGNYLLSFAQKFQHLQGHAIQGSERIPLQGAQLEGNRIRFLLPEVQDGREVSREFTGTIDGNVINGVIGSDDGSVPWRATRIDPPHPLRQSR
jgi:ubiquinone/menaquinone biosynthesis C-methylase UbiE